MDLLRKKINGRYNYDIGPRHPITFFFIWIYSISHPLAPDCQGRATSLPDTQTNLTMYFKHDRPPAVHVHCREYIKTMLVLCALVNNIPLTFNCVERFIRRSQN